MPSLTGSDRDPAILAEDPSPAAYWTPRRLRIHAWLEAEAPAVAPVYEGAVRLAMDSDFPGRIWFVAHALRDMRNRLPDAIAGPIKGSNTQYRHLAAEVTRCWKIIDLVGAPTFGNSVVDRLVDVARTDPVVAVDLLAGMLARPENEWDDLAWRDSAEKVLIIARDSGVPGAIPSMREIVDRYVRLGRTEFRALAPPASDNAGV